MSSTSPSLTSRGAQPIKIGASNRYVARLPTVPLNLRLLGDDRAPLGGMAYTVHGLGQPVTGTTKADGRLAAPLSVPVLVRELWVTLGNGTVLHVAVGHMDPIETNQGVRKRLAHLGHLPIHGDRLLSEEEADALFNYAVKRFQSSHGLKATGVTDEGTRGAVKLAHGE
jgi:hypothetical protein